MANIAETVKKQTDRILRQRTLNGSEGVVVSGVASGTGAPAPTVNNPPVDLTAHKTSGDHDGRYYTEDEIDGMLTFVSLSDTPAAYTGEGGKIVAVKADVSGLEFVSAPPATNGIPTGGTNNQLLAKDGATDYVVKWMDAPAAANGLPEGGTAGQVLEKIDSTDYNAQWATPIAGGGLDANGVMEFPLDTPPNDPVSGSVLVFADYLPSETNSIPQMTANNAPSGVCSGSEKYSTVEYWHAFENTGAHPGWITNGSALPQYIQYQFASAKTIVAYSMRAWYVDNYPSRTPKNWTFQGSVDGSNWDSLDTRVGYVPTSASDYKLFVCKFRGSYSYYRLYITANNGNAYTGISGLKMFEAGTVVGLAIRQSDGSYLLMGY